MSMWVYNRVICNKNARDEIINTNANKESHFYCMSLMEEKINDNKYILKFETHGANYYDDEIRKIISKYTETVWQCMEEETIEQGKYYYDGKKVVLEKRDLAYGKRNNIVDYLCFNSGTYIWWPRYGISIAEDEKTLTINDIDNFLNYDYTMTDEDYEYILNLCKKYADETDEWQESSFHIDNDLQYELSLSIQNSVYRCLICNDNEVYETERKEDFIFVANELNKIIHKYNDTYDIVLKYD